MKKQHRLSFILVAGAAVIGLLLLIVVVVSRQPITFAQVPPAGTMCVLFPDFCNVSAVVPPAAIDTVSKSLNPWILRSTSQSQVTIDFRVTSPGVKRANLKEKLAKDNNPYIQVDGTQVTVDGATQTISLKDSDTAFDLDLGDLAPGDHTVSFKIKYLPSGPIGVEKPVDKVSSGNCQASAHFNYFIDSDPGEKCTPIEAGHIKKEAAKLRLESDLWVGDKTSSLREGQALALSPTGLIISGGDITPGNSLRISDYQIPSAGKLVWSDLNSQMESRVKRSITTGAATPLPCTDGQNVTTVDFSSTPIIYLQRSASTSADTTKGCRITMTDTTHFIGRGTLINNQGSLELKGSVSAQRSGDTMGYIGLGPGADITIFDQAAPQNMAIFTNGTLTLGAKDTSVSDTNAAERVYVTKFIAQRINFPVAGSLRNDLVIREATTVASNPPPLFEQFYLPQGREVP